MVKIEANTSHGGDPSSSRDEGGPQVTNAQYRLFGLKGRLHLLGTVTHAWVQHSVQTLDDQINDDVSAGAQEDDRLHDREVLALDRVDGQRANTRPVEDL